MASDKKTRLSADQSRIDAARTAWQANRGPAARRSRAITRNADRVKLSPTQRLALLDERLGAGVGATRERARLERLIAAAKAAKAVKDATPTTAKADKPSTPRRNHSAKQARAASKQ